MPCYMVINGKKQEMDGDIFDQIFEALHHSNNPTAHQPRHPPIGNRPSWQETISRPRLFFKMLSKETIKTLPMPRLWTDHQQ